MAGLDDLIARLELEDKHLTNAIKRGMALESLEAEAVELKKNLTKARADRAELADQGESAGAFKSAAEIAAALADVLPWLASVSRDFADILRRLIPSFVVFPVQALDTPAVRPRARFTLSAAPWAMGGVTVPDVTFTVDLFDPPVHILHQRACRDVKSAEPSASLQDIADKLGINRMTVKRALDYGKLMDKAQVSDPYQELTSCPRSASRWRQKQSASVKEQVVVAE